MKRKYIVYTISLLLFYSIVAGTKGYAEGDNRFSLGYGVLTASGSDSKNNPPVAITAKYGIGGDSEFRPYVGAGLAYSLSGDNKAGDLSSRIKTGFAYQVGFNYMLNSNAFLNLDYKILDISADVPLRGNDTNPRLLGFGFNLKF